MGSIASCVRVVWHEYVSALTGLGGAFKCTKHIKMFKLKSVTAHELQTDRRTQSCVVMDKHIYMYLILRYFEKEKKICNNHLVER